MAILPGLEERKDSFKTEYTKAETEGNSKENTNSTVVNSDINSLGENIDESQASSSKQNTEMLVKLRREKTTRKTKVTKFKHYLQKVCSISKDGDNNAEIDNCVNELWKILEETQLVMDELSGLYLQLNDIKMHKEVMQESDNLQLDIQQTIDSAQEIVASPALSEQSKSSVESATSPLGGDILTEPSHISPTTMQRSNNLDMPSSNNTGSPNNQPQENPTTGESCIKYKFKSSSPNASAAQPNSMKGHQPLITT